MTGLVPKRATYAEYLAIELKTNLRHEYVDGEIRAMSGGTLRHCKLRTNLTGLLNSSLGDGPCQVYDSDLKIFVDSVRLATYPDAAIICGPLETHPEDKNAVTNPRVLLEVLSPSTESWDRGGKFLSYQEIPSLQEYLLLSPDEPRVERYTRQEDGSWRYQRYGAGDTVPIEAAGVELPLERLYRNLPAAEPLTRS